MKIFFTLFLLVLFLQASNGQTIKGKWENTDQFYKSIELKSLSKGSLTREEQTFTMDSYQVEALENGNLILNYTLKLHDITQDYRAVVRFVDEDTILYKTVDDKLQQDQFRINILDQGITFNRINK